MTKKKRRKACDFGLVPHSLYGTCTGLLGFKSLLRSALRFNEDRLVRA